ncbi:anti-lipopolysaccharide factor [Procambarus clarkii]|uniref:anti-lipopolysaccharide factor n=1 Tax=Procambarus clarkii TaxID=6728 RepID=UPI001E674AD2|nr:anti-lipopolysaccharide factor-like [Procambarus clarkii]
MRIHVVVSVVLVALAVSCLVPGTHAQGWEAVAAAVAQKLVGLFRNEEVELLGRICKLTVKPYIKRFQLYHKGTMSCPGWTHIKGEGDTRSASGVANKTIQDFVRKAFASGVIQEEEAQHWLKS